MRRVTLMVAAMALMVSLFAAVAYAASIEGTADPERLLESSLDDTIFGRSGGDLIFANAFGADGFILQTPEDTDVSKGNAGNDYINVDDGDGRDTANGGNGEDTCVIDANDTPPISCETVRVDTRE
jgi:Ca2+-binding RTX toxin-like protein